MEKCVLNARKSGEELVCAGYVMYSSSTVMMLTCGDGVYGFTLDTATGEYVLSLSRRRQDPRPRPAHLLG